jgi:hypothetical protein
VLNKLRPWDDGEHGPSVLGGSRRGLFPGAVNEEESRTNEERELQLPGEEPRETTGNWSPESAITEDELTGAVEKIEARKAPGPDGVPARLSKEVAGFFAPRLRTLFDKCLSRGEFLVL